MRNRFTHALKSDAGFAVPTVMLALFAAIGLASAAVVASVNSQRGTVRDQDSKQAFAAAEAGVNDAMLNFNRIAHTDPTCVVGTLSGEWCVVGSQALTGVSGTSYSYAVRPTTVDGQDQIEIVSTGTADGVTRRVEVVARSAGGLKPFSSGASVVGDLGITLDSNTSITADGVGTNGNVTLLSNAQLDCNIAIVGPGGQVTTQSNAFYTCDPSVPQGVSVPPVNQGDVATNNQNGYFFATNTYTGKRPEWNPTARTLVLDSDSTLTLNSGNYSLCRLETKSNSSIRLVAGAKINIYFDSPEACNQSSGTYQLLMDSNSRITTTGSGPIDVAMLFVGSATRRTNAVLASNTQVPSGACEQDFVIYAPRTDIRMDSNSTFCGAMAGRTLTLLSNAYIATSSLAKDFELPNAVPAHYGPEQFVECSATAGATPDSGC